MADQRLRELERDHSLEGRWRLVRVLMQHGTSQNLAHRQVFGIGPRDVWARASKASGYLHLLPHWTGHPQVSLTRSACPRHCKRGFGEIVVVDLNAFRAGELDVPVCRPASA